jgi:hypothetical protein
VAIPTALPVISIDVGLQVVAVEVVVSVPLELKPDMFNMFGIACRIKSDSQMFVFASILSRHQHDIDDPIIGTKSPCECLEYSLVKRRIRVIHVDSRRDRRFFALHPSSLFEDTLIFADCQPVVDIGPDCFECVVIA